MTEKIQGTIFDIKHYAIHDGPGIRTTVFLKGCPLECPWCANPESQQPKPEIMFDEILCQKCQACAEACPNAAIEFKDNNRLHNRSICSGCGQCSKVCAFDAIELCGYPIDIKSLWDQIKDDRAFWDQSGGGVTLSGGEPLFQHEFVLKFLDLCKEQHIHTAIETCGYAQESNFLKILPVTDLVIFDFKIDNPKIHKKVIGVSNNLIKNNLVNLLESNKESLVRMPLIPGCNDTFDEIHNICSFIEKVKPGASLEVLPYHRLGEKKYARLGRYYELSGIETPNQTQIEKIKQILIEFDLNFKIESDLEIRSRSLQANTIDNFQTEV